MGEPITEAVVAIPAFFQTDQIEATKRAIQMAGLELKMLVKEPTAAAIAYNEDRKLEDSKIMIFDFGGGGQDFDGIIMNYVLQEYKKKSTYDILGNKRLVKRLRAECRLAKEMLSFNAYYNIHLDIDLDDDSDLNVELTKTKFNELCEELYTRTSKLIDDALRMANFRTDDIDHILVGGSTRIPAIKSILKVKFGQNKLKFNIHPDKAVVFGAAILADAIEDQILLNGVYGHLWLVSKTNCIIWVEARIELIREVLKSCLCFDPSAPVDSQISRIAGMNYAKNEHAVIATNGKLYAIGGFQKLGQKDFCNSIEEYDPQTNKWREVGKISALETEPFVSSNPIRSEEMEEMTYIGIHLGMTSSRVSVYIDDKPFVIPNEYGHNATLSEVSFHDEEIVVGRNRLRYRKDKAIIANTIYDINCVIGCSTLNELHGAYKERYWTFNVEERNNCVGYVLNKRSINERFMRPEEVLAEVLKKMKSIAENFLSRKVTGAVITIPILYSDAQITATKKAIEIAEIPSKCLLYEPIAAAIGFYNMEKKVLEGSKVLIFNWGGAMLDVTVADILDERIIVKAVAKDENLGGQAIDDIILKHAIGEFSLHSNYNIHDRPELIRKLRSICRENKERLSSDSKTKIYVELPNDLELNIDLTQTILDALCTKIYDKIMQLVGRVLDVASVKKSQIDHVCLVGGSTKIPEIRKRLIDEFGREKIRYSPYPDLITAMGTSIAARNLKIGISIPLLNVTLEDLKSAKSKAMRVIRKAEAPRLLKVNEVLFYLSYDVQRLFEPRICIFNTNTLTVQHVLNFERNPWPFSVATSHNELSSIHFDGNENNDCLFEMFNLEALQITTGTNPPQPVDNSSVSYHRGNVYYLNQPIIEGARKRFDIHVNGVWIRVRDFPIECYAARIVPCASILYVIDVRNSGRIFRLSDDEQNWEELGQIPQPREGIAVVAFNRKIYFTGGLRDDVVSMSCGCFDPAAPEGNRIAEIADMNYGRYHHSLIAANDKLYAIGG
ncbi:hypothetical protein WR25_17308 isoform C [Diploscapter pachys]|nr:hypothetical protein WR25_17308 isoform C [Diploscapter pachys]